MVGAFANDKHLFLRLDFCCLILMLAFAVPTINLPIILDA
jgi:hypothetical protein